ncbi:MAG: PH domain-containing protein [Propionibacteriaceae bacterium]|jgi:membrane protein YdbS with pleckstrin-like domain|nr:PH domain-containing protein [Propionibacteriaceae bacterium]
MAGRPSLLRPDVEQYLLKDQNERLIDEVVKHPIAMIGPLLMAILGCLLMLASPAAGVGWWVMVLVGAVLGFRGLWVLHVRSMDRFVITNMRVFRVKGVFDRNVATMPLTRILDISVNQPPLGLLFNYGHFTFESAAADQGLHEIRFVGDPNGRDLTIQRVIQRAGIRAVASPRVDLPDGT